MSWLLILLIGLPAAAGAALALAGAKADRFAAVLSVVVSALVLGTASAAAALRPSLAAPFLAGSEFGLSVDALSGMLLPAVAGVAFLVLLYAAASDIDGDGIPEIAFETNWPDRRI